MKTASDTMEIRYTSAVVLPDCLLMIFIKEGVNRMKGHRLNTETIPINDRSHVLTASDGSVWIGYESDGVVQRVDGRTGQVIATIATGALDMESDGDITAGGGFVWFITRSSTIAQIEPKTNSLRGIFRAKSGSVIGRRIRYAGGSLWVSGGSIFRIEGPK